MDGIPFHPYYTVHDIFGVTVFLFIFSAVVFFAPEFGGYFLEYNNFIPADPLKTPAHIAPVWYFTPFYSMLRAITTEMMYVLVLCVVAGAGFGVLKAKLPSFVKAGIAGAAVVVIAMMLSIDAKFWGVVVMGGAVVILFALPWLDYCEVKSIRYRPSWHKYMYGIFVINFVALAYLGVQPPSPVMNLAPMPSCLICLLVSSISLRNLAAADPADSKVALRFSLAESVTEYFLSVMLLHSQPGQRQLITAQGSRNPPPLDLLFRCRVDQRNYIDQAFDVCRGK